MKRFLVILSVALCLVLYFTLTKKDQPEIKPERISKEVSKEQLEKSSLSFPEKVKVKAKTQKFQKIAPSELYKMHNNQKLMHHEDLVKEIVGDTDKKIFNSRVSKAANLNISKLDDYHIKQLEEYLLNQNKDDIYENSIKTGLIDSFISNNHRLADFGNKLLIVLKDSNRSEVLRDYLLQFVPDYYEKRFIKTEEEDIIVEQTETKDTLLSIIKDTESSLSGTALISFKRMVEIDNKNFPKSELHELARLVAKSDEHRNRATAINLLGNSFEDLTILESFIYSDKEPQIVRISAMTSLSKKDLSEFPEVKQLFIEFMNDHKFKNERMKLIASASLKRVQ